MMRFIIYFILFSLSFVGVSYGAKSVMHENGKVLITDFAEKNNLVSTRNLSVFVDLYRDGCDDATGNVYSSAVVSPLYWSDCELKVLDKDGNIIYFFSTIYFNSKQVQSLHDPKYNDNDAIVYYYVSGSNYNNGVCVKPKKQLTDFNRSIGAIEKASTGTNYAYDNRVRITAIQIYPSEKFKSVFLNPENSIMVWRQSIYSSEVDGKQEKLWRPAIIQFIR